MKIGAVVLAAGRGSRMGMEIPKQYLEVAKKPLLIHSLLAFEKSKVDVVALVVTGGDEEYCAQLLKEHGIKKVKYIVAGGSERYFSVYEGLKALEEAQCDIVSIHDGARPMVDDLHIQRGIEDTIKYGASVLAVPVKDTIRFADEDGFGAQTPDRRKLWSIQTPQTFFYADCKSAYDQCVLEKKLDGITDDAMVLEKILGKRAKLTMGMYQNIKVTTPEDIGIAEEFLQ